MSDQQSTAETSLAQQTSPYGYAYWEWVAREAPEYVKARIPLSALSVGKGKALAVKSREMAVIGLLALRGVSQEGMLLACWCGASFMVAWVAREARVIEQVHARRCCDIMACT